MEFGQFDRTPAVVLGLGQNGLAAVRALGRTGVPVIGIDSDLEQPGAQTRYCTKLYCAEFAKGGDRLLECLLELGRELERRGHKGVVIPTGDLNIELVSERREELAPYYHLSLPSKEVLRLFLDKKSFYKLAMERGFPLPRTWFTEGDHDIDAISADIAYPCLIKPFQPNASWRQTFDTRLFLADSRDMLRRLYDLIYPVHQDLIIQEYMPGDDGQVCWGVTYLDAQQRPLAKWAGRKLRQYPRGFGTATLAESLDDPELAEMAVDILTRVGHRGYGVVEFKRDRRDGKRKITEATGGRTWFPHSIVTRSGINLPYIWYRDVLGLPVQPQTEYEPGIKWIHEERDLKTVALYFLPEKRLTLWSWLRSYGGRRTYAYAAWDDPRPFLSSLGRIVKAGQTRAKRMLRAKEAERARVRESRPKHLQDLLLAADPTVGRGLRRVTVD
jgi:predicted ATP-grasp superfamily ATP-dependent carboligase